MSTRFKTGSKTNYGISPLPTGYATSTGVPDLSIPPCGVEDVDVALFELFDKEIVPEYGGKNSTPVSKVPVVFAAGEKWALLKNGRPIRDRNNSLLLPLITIMRTDLVQGSEDFTGRGINQQVGEFVIRRRLDKSDRGYQALINKILLQNQQNLAVAPGQNVVPGEVTTDRSLGELSTNPEMKDGAYLTPRRLNNVFETIVVPTPQFFTAKYQITIWTQYTQHSNQIIEKIMSSLLPQAQSWKLTTPKGYWFVAKLEDGNFAVETNFDDMSQAERFIKHTFSVSVPAYFFASASPGTPIPIKRYVSSPVISFETATDPVEIGSETKLSKYVVGSDDPTLPINDTRLNQADQRQTGTQRLFPRQPNYQGYVDGDPAASGLPRGYEPKVLSRSPGGETVYSMQGGLELIRVKDLTKI